MHRKIFIGVLLVAFVCLIVFIGWVCLWGSAESISFQEKVPVLDVADLRIETEHVTVPLNERMLNFALPNHWELHLSDTSFLGMVVPHHLLVESWIAESFAILGKQPVSPKTIVLLSPNHDERGDAFIATADVAWEVSEGTVLPDSERVRELENGADIVSDANVVASEHGVYNLLPYLRHFLPYTRVVPIVFRYNVSDADISRLVDVLAPWVASGDVAVVASVDFAHYLPSHELEIRDDESLRALETRDYRWIRSFQSDHVDSPGAIVTLLRTMDRVGASHMNMLEQGNSGSLFKHEFEPGTSYFVIGFSSL